MAKPTIPSPDDYNTDNEILPPSAAQDAPPTEEGYDTDDTDTYISRKASAAAIFISKLLDLEPEELAKNLMENDNLQFLSSLDDAELLKRVFDIVKEQQKKFSSQHPDFPGVKELIRHDNFHLLCYPNPSRNFLKAIFHELKETGELQEAMHKTSFFALESFYRIADKEDLILIKTILADFADAEQEAYILNHLSLTSILERGGDEAFKWWINNASKLGCLDELMRKNLPYFDMKAKEDPEFVTKLIPAFMELKQQAAICLRYSNEENASAVFKEIWRYIPPEQQSEIISRNNYQLFVEIAGTNDAELVKQFLKIVEECDSKAYPPSRQIKQILSLDDVDNILTAPICRALSKAAANNAAKSFKLLFSQLNPEQKSALMGTQAIFSSLPILLDSATNHQFGNVDIISDLFRCMSTVEKARCLHRYLSNRIADTVNFSLASSILDVVDFYEAAIAREMVGGRFLQNEAFMTFARCADFLNLSSPHNREYAKSTPLNFAREIMRQTIVAVTNAIIPDGDDDSALSEEVKARRKYLAHIGGDNSTNHTRSLIHCATRKMGALIMDNLQQFRDGRNISIALEQAFHDPALDSKEPLSQAIQANKDIGALIFKAAMPNLEKIMPTDVIQWADFHPDSEVATSSPEAIAADIAKANKVMQEIYRDIKTEIFATSGRPTTSVNPAATATAAAPQNPSQATSAK